MSFQKGPHFSPGDFFELLGNSGYRWHARIDPSQMQNGITVTQGTTVLAFHFKDGVLVAGDRRATAGNSIMYERCDKVIPIDDYTLMAIAGVPATAFEMARVLTHNFEYYRRSQLQTMSVEGKIRALSKLLKENVGMAVQGLGGVSPIFATYDLKSKKAAIHFYDMLGADFRISTHTATGSGSPTIRGILEYEDLWGEKPLVERSENDAVTLAIRLLQTAAQFDSATGKALPEDEIFPTIALITESGYRFLNDQDMGSLCQASLKRGRAIPGGD
jgi:proteasome beta subunit